MDVGAEARVVGQVPAIVVRIFVNDDLIGIPEPVVAETVVVRSDVEVETAKPEAGRAAAGEAEPMAAAEAARKASMLPRMIEMVVGIIAAGVVADPFIVGMDVGGVRVSGLVAEDGMFLDRTRIATERSWTVSGNVSTANAMRWMLRGRSFGPRKCGEEEGQ